MGQSYCKNLIKNWNDIDPAIVHLADSKMEKINAYILLGGNEGNVPAQLHKAAAMLEQYAGNIKRRSSLYQTAAWGNTDQPDFLNQVLIIETTLEPEALLAECLRIEKNLGRIRTIRNAPRTIDIDILFYGDRVYASQQLEIPHKEIPYRRFVLVPLDELSPGMQHPVLHGTIHTLLLKCTDQLDVKKI